MSRRTKKVQSLLMSHLSMLLLTEVSDPSLQNISISEVKLTDDLKEARIFFIVRGEGRPDLKRLKAIKAGFQRAASFLRRELGEELELRIVPELKFEYDEHFNEVTRLMLLLDNVKQVDQVQS